jgi:hypothetical protein
VFVTWPAAIVADALSLADRGLTTTAISRRTGVPRKTVDHWLHRSVPRGRLAVRNTCAECAHAPHEPDDLPPEYLYLLGVYLGDGCISAHPRGVHRLRIFLDARYPGIIEEVAAAMRAVVPLSAVGRHGRASCYSTEPDGAKTTIEVSSYSRSWPCLIPQSGPGKKHERVIELTGWQRELVEGDPRPLLRGLVHSDGCRFINTGRGGWREPRYSFVNRSDDIRAIFSDACDQLGLHWTAAPDTVYVSRKADVARMDEFVGPKA